MDELSVTVTSVNITNEIVAYTSQPMIVPSNLSKANVELELIIPTSFNRPELLDGRLQQAIEIAVRELFSTGNFTKIIESSIERFGALGKREL
jgi:hypothetical protein